MPALPQRGSTHQPSRAAWVALGKTVTGLSNTWTHRPKGGKPPLSSNLAFAALNRLFCWRGNCFGLRCPRYEPGR